MKSNTRAALLILSGLFLFVLTATCQQQKAMAPASTAIELTDEKLLSLANRVGVQDEQVFQEIASYPRAEVIDKLQKLRDNPSTGEQQRVGIAYLLCNLDHEVANNKKILVDAFAHEPHSKNNFADWEAELLNRLLKKGHKDLLAPLFAASEWSDGALSEELEDCYTDQLRSAPEDFVLSLSQQPLNIRKAVCTQLEYARGDLSPKDRQRFEKYFRSSTDPRIKSTWEEIFRALDKKEE